MKFDPGWNGTGQCLWLESSYTSEWEFEWQETGWKRRLPSSVVEPRTWK